MFPIFAFCGIDASATKFLLKKLVLLPTRNFKCFLAETICSFVNQELIPSSLYAADDLKADATVLLLRYLYNETPYK